MADNHQFKQLNDIYDGAAYLVAKDGLSVIDALETSILKWKLANEEGCQCGACLGAKGRFIYDPLGNLLDDIMEPEED